MEEVEGTLLCVGAGWILIMISSVFWSTYLSQYHREL